MHRFSIRWASDHEHRWLARLNVWAHRTSVRRWAKVMARLGNIEGCLLIWGLLALIDPRIGLRLLIAGGLGLLVFKAIKHALKRPRPFRALEHIIAHDVPPDEFSFPSGPTLHAASLATVISWAWPWCWSFALAWLAMMAVSRVALGMHYPSDTALGAVLGVALGLGVSLLV